MMCAWVCICDGLLNLQLYAVFKPLGILFVLNKKQQAEVKRQESGKMGRKCPVQRRKATNSECTQEISTLRAVGP